MYWIKVIARIFCLNRGGEKNLASMREDAVEMRWQREMWCWGKAELQAARSGKKLKVGPEALYVLKIFSLYSALDKYP